ncbi:MAG TPA: glycosyltransferase family 4 protein [Rubrivivax sp.]|nr:glycosyltransferase family 4 protein [Rubrivivax sp.]
MTGMVGLTGLRIALVGPVPPPAGGMAMQTRQLAELLKQEHAQVELVATNAPYRPAVVERLPIIRALFRLVPYCFALWRTAGRADVLHLMANSGWSWHLFAVPALWVARLRRVPAVVNYRGGEAGAFLQRRAGWVRAGLRDARLVVPSAFLQQVFAAHGMAAQIVPNIVDLVRFRRAAAQADGERAPRLLVARNLEPIYDNATALRAFALVVRPHPRAQLTLAGTGPQLAELQRLAAELGIDDRVCFAGRLDRDDMAAKLRDSTVAINPSTIDNMPNSVLEALASGVPVVSTNVGGVPFIVEHGIDALLVPPADPTAMAQAVLRLLADPELVQQLVEAGLRTANAYTWERVGPQWAAVYRIACSAPADAATATRVR